MSLGADAVRSSLKELNTGLDLAKTVFEKQEQLWLNEQIGQNSVFANQKQL